MSPTTLLQAALSKRTESGLLRSLTIAPHNSSDFSSNDYLSLSRSKHLHAKFLAKLQTSQHLGGGSTGSRLLTGNSNAACQLETYLAAFHGAETALLFNSGYDANLGLFETLPHPGSAVLYDELVHASVHDGMRRSRDGVVKLKWRHNSVQHLEQLVWEQVTRIESLGLTKERLPGIFVVVEAIYSMDGDVAPLVEICKLAEKVGARAGGLSLIVDEAHSTGVCGLGGRGLVCQLGLQDKVFARLHTFGKGVGAHGGNKQVSKVCTHLRQKGYDVRPIRSPTVQKGSERLRICLHVHNTEQQIWGLIREVSVASGLVAGLDLGSKL
ncbi:UNVERIFIED_CONTAM: biotin synthase [Siphonaria sp. JEL0065]|nr:biotin synthase [Siphonaria sp. JEL0065]